MLPWGFSTTFLRFLPVQINQWELEISISTNPNYKKLINSIIYIQLYSWHDKFRHANFHLCLCMLLNLGLGPPTLSSDFPELQAEMSGHCHWYFVILLRKCWCRKTSEHKFSPYVDNKLARIIFHTQICGPIVFVRPKFLAPRLSIKIQVERARDRQIQREQKRTKRVQKVQICRSDERKHCLLLVTVGYYKGAKRSTSQTWEANAFKHWVAN